MILTDTQRQTVVDALAVGAPIRLIANTLGVSRTTLTRTINDDESLMELRASSRKSIELYTTAYEQAKNGCPHMLKFLLNSQLDQATDSDEKGDTTQALPDFTVIFGPDPDALD